MIIEIFKDYFEENKKEQKEYIDNKSSENHFYPTSSSAFVNHGKYKKLEGKCLRSSYYSFFNIPDESELQVGPSLIMKMGNYIEYMILDIFEKKNILIDKSVKFKIDKYNISGKVDCIIKDGEKEVGIEIKTINSNKWTIASIFGSEYLEPFPKWQHLFQTLIYCYAFRDRIDKFIILYVRRDTGEIKEFEVSIVAEKEYIYPVINGRINRSITLNEILNRYSQLQSYIIRKELPPREYFDIYPKENIETYYGLGIISKTQLDKYRKIPFGDYNCIYCPYKNLCDKNYNIGANNEKYSDKKIPYWG